MEVKPATEKSLESAKRLASRFGDPDIVAGILVREGKNIPDDTRHELMREASQNELNFVKSHVLDGNPNWLKSKAKKAKALARSKKSGKDFDDQLKAMYNYPRADFNNPK